MAAKRAFPSANGGRGESPTRSGGSKRLCSGRHDQGCTLQELMEKLNPSDLQLVFSILCRGSTLQEFMEKQNPSDLLLAFNILCRGCTLREFMEKLNPSDLQRVEDLCQKYRVNVPHLSSRARMYRLLFRNKLPNILFTDRKLKAESEMKVEIAIVDASNMVISSGPEAKAEIEIVVLDGDFYGGECTEEEFNKHVIVARQNKPPLLSGNLFIKLCDGVGYITDAKFTDNSSWTKSKNFSLGARLHRGEGIAGKVREGISNAFRVKDRHGEKNQKDRPPAMNDDVCCLKGISKIGSYKKKLVECNIKTVRDFLNYCDIHSPEKLRTMLGMTEGNWEKTYGHARESKYLSNINRQLLNGPGNLHAPDQNSFDAGSKSSQISNALVQRGIMPSTSNVKCESDLFSNVQSLPSTKSSFELRNSFKRIVIRGGSAWKGTEEIGISYEELMEGCGKKYWPDKFDISSMSPNHKWLKILFVARLKVAAQRSRESKVFYASSPQGSFLSCSYSEPQWDDLLPL